MFPKHKSAMVVKSLILTVIVLFVLIKWGRPMVNVLDKAILSKPEIVHLNMKQSHILGDRLYLNDYFPNLKDVEVDDQGRVFLKADGKEIILGKTTPNQREDYSFDFTVEAGDSIHFTRRHSFFAWLTPFEINFMGGPSPYKKRYLYYTLLWTKKDGSILRARWKFEQSKYGGGWGNSQIIDGRKDDLIELVIEKK